MAVDIFGNDLDPPDLFTAPPPTPDVPAPVAPAPPPALAAPSPSAKAPDMPSGILAALQAEAWNAQSRADPTFNPRDALWNSQRSFFDTRLKDEASKLGNIDYSSELGDIERWVRAAENMGKDASPALAGAIAKLKQRATNTPNQERGLFSPGPGGGVPGSLANDVRAMPVPSGLPPYQANVTPQPGNQFSDPYTNFLEQISKQNIASLQGQNDQFTQLMNFLNQQFSTLSTSQGYTPDEMAVLRTQALEPIEAQRQAAQQHVLENAGARGILPSSGVVQSLQADTNRGFDQSRTAANRDLAINAINQQRAKRQEALGLAQLGVSIPDARQAQALGIANNLYQLPRQAMLDAESIINSSAPSNALTPLVSLLNGQGELDLRRQGLNFDQNAAYGAMIQQLIRALFGGTGT